MAQGMGYCSSYSRLQESLAVILLRTQIALLAYTKYLSKNILERLDFKMGKSEKFELIETLEKAKSRIIFVVDYVL